MTRFNKLEFDDEQPPRRETEPAAARRDDIDWMKQADQNRRSGLYENALKFYSRALERDKSRVDGWLGQVQMLVLLGEYPEAELWARKALELFPAHGDLMAARAQALCRLRDSVRAHEACDGSLKQSGQSAYRWLVRGELMLAARQSVDQYCFDKARQLDADWLVSVEIALIYLFYHNPSRALLRVRAACEAAPDQSYAWLVQARCQQAMGLEEQARRSVQTCLELCPGHELGRQLLADLGQQPWTAWGRRLRNWFRSS
jgi:tetratricopeptide (TPR) repeat protein